MSSSAHNARSQAVEDGQLPRQQESGHGQTAHDLSTSSLTIPSDSEPYSSLSPPSTSPPPHSIHNREERDSRSDREQSKTVLVYTRPTFWSLVRGAVINLLLPFVNGMMLGLGELLAHEIAFRWGWGTTQIFPKHRTASSSTSSSRAIGPGIEVRDDPVERRKRRGAPDADLMNTTALE